MSAPLLRATGLTKRFGGGLGSPSVLAVDGAGIEVPAGSVVALVGESGSGKSTLGRLLNRLVEPDAGRIEFAGEDVGAMDPAALRRFRRRVQMVFQDPNASLNPRHSIATTLTRPLRLHGIAATAGEARERAAAALAEVGIGPDALDRFPHEFSGGQRQRIGIARAISVGPELLICDEPVSALDVSVQAQLVNLLERLKETRGLAQLFIAHDLALVRRIADRVAVMYRGRIVEEGPVRALFDAPAHPYTRALLDAVPRFGAPPEEATAPVRDGAAPGGCRYAERCAVAQERCLNEPPALRSVREGQLAACHFPLAPGVPGPPSAGSARRAARIEAFAAAVAERSPPID